MPFYLLFTLAAIWLAPATAGAGDVLHAVSPNLIQRILSGEGGEAEVAETEADTTVEGLIDGKAYSVLFYECDGGAFDAPATPTSTGPTLPSTVIRSPAISPPRGWASPPRIAPGW